MEGDAARPHNPYIAGRSLGEERGFFGREDLFSLVEAELSSPDWNAIVFYGQRRVGKTSLLLQLRRRLLAPTFIPIYFDLMGCARRPMGKVLFELASTIGREVGIPIDDADCFDDEGLHFQRKFLPDIYEKLDEGSRLVLLFDESDVLDAATQKQLPEQATIHSFFPYLGQLIEQEPQIGFICAIGRKAEDLSGDMQAAFKTARSKSVAMLDQEETRQLITLSQRQGTLEFPPAAIGRIFELTAGHPYFTQLLCQLLWDDAHSRASHESPSVIPAAVDAMIPKTLEAGENVFEWIWAGIPPAERVILAAIAEATNRQRSVSEGEVLGLLQKYGLHFFQQGLKLAPATLVRWELIREVNGGYQCIVELMRRWVISQKPVAWVKDELDRTVPVADTLYQDGYAYYQRREREQAQSFLQQALSLDPHHVQARLLLSQLLLEQGHFDEAIRELEEAYRYDENTARYPLGRALLAKAEELRQQDKADDALAFYERTLELIPNERLAQERRAAIWIHRGDQAYETWLRRDAGTGETDEVRDAFLSYAQARENEKVYKIQSLLQVLREKGNRLEQDGKYAEALHQYSQILEIFPHDELAQERVGFLKRDLLARGEELERLERPAEALPYYERISDAFPHDALAHERKLAIWVTCGDNAFSYWLDRGSRSFSVENIQQIFADYVKAEAAEKVAIIQSLLRALLLKGEELERAGKWSAALGQYQQILRFFPGDRVAQEHVAALWKKRGSEAQQNGHLRAALYAFQQAGAEAEVQQMEVLLEPTQEEREQSQQRLRWTSAALTMSLMTSYASWVKSIDAPQSMFFSLMIASWLMAFICFCTLLKK